MSDELREYAQRIVDCVSRSDDDFGRTYQRDTEKQGFGLLEPYELAVAYLAEHPADDGDLIDEAWLESVMPYDDEIERHMAYGHAHFPLVSADEQGHWEFGMSKVPTPQTRGDLRRLCSALGITLEEQG